MSDSLQDAFGEFGDSEFKGRIVEEYGDKLKNQELMGEELDIADLGTSMRKYDHGQADSSTVTEYGVKIVFDSSKVDLSALEDGGRIHQEIHSIADELIAKPVEYIEVSFVTNDAYEVWVILDADSL